MSKIKRLTDSYGQFISLPWRDDTAAAQRVIFCVYPETEELRLRANLDEFELVTRQNGHEWVTFDLTDTFALWMAEQKYATSYFKSPTKLTTVIHRYLDWLEQRFMRQLSEHSVDDNHVVAVHGVSSCSTSVKEKSTPDTCTAPGTDARSLLIKHNPGSPCHTHNRRSTAPPALRIV